MMRSGFSLVLLLTACASGTGIGVAAPASVSDAEARSAIGRVATVVGPVTQVKTRAHHGYAYLNFGGAFPAHTFSVLIPDSALARFGDLARFEGHRARATGVIWLQDEKYPAITLTDPAALELLP
jgi:hypothetical protein